jgi:hypothetical protein
MTIDHVRFCADKYLKKLLRFPLGGGTDDAAPKLDATASKAIEMFIRDARAAYGSLLARRERPNTAGFSQEREIAYFAGAVILLSALIFGGLHTRYRNRYQRKVSDQIVRDRYEHNIN